MVTSRSIIEINGRHYDAQNGLSVSKNVGPSRPENNKPVISDIVRPKALIKSAPQKTTARPATNTAFTLHQSNRKTAAHTMPHHQQHATTLLRKAVKKPSIVFEKSLIKKPLSPFTEHLIIVTRPRVLSHHDYRLQLAHAKQIQKNKLIQHFNFEAAESKNPVAYHIPVHLPAQKTTNEVMHKEKPTKADPFETAIAHATSHTEQLHKKHRRHRFALWGSA